MSIYRLGSDVWENIVLYLDISDSIRLLITGDTTLRTRLKPAIRDFVHCLSTPTSPSLSWLLNIVKHTCYKPRRLSLSLGTWHQLLRFVDEKYTAEKWKTLFPEHLETLELALWCYAAPFTSLLACLDTVTPELKKLLLYHVPEKLALPPFLTSLEFGALEGRSLDYKSALSAPNFFETMPTTLTSLKIDSTITLKPQIDADKVPFKNMPLTVFHACINFLSFTEDQARWSILPNTLLDLRAELRYGIDREVFKFPSVPSWRQLFPSLKSINVPLKCLTDAPYFLELSSEMDGQILEEKFKKIRNSFPESLTALSLVPIRSPYVRAAYTDIPIVVKALGAQLRSLKHSREFTSPLVIKLVPKWENPRVTLLKTIPSLFSPALEIDESENYQNFLGKNHPISHLYRNATSLEPGLLPASALSFLPRTITFMKFDVAQNEPLSLKSASEAYERLKSNAMDSCTTNFEPNLGWKVLRWPPSLTKLMLAFHLPQPLHFGCLPATLTDLSIIVKSGCVLTFEGGDLAHLTELSELQLMSFVGPLITTLNGLPRSLRTLSATGDPIGSEVLANPGLQNFFFNLEILDISGCDSDADVLLYLPKTLTILYIKIIQDGAAMCEKHFEGIFRNKLSRLILIGDANWSPELNLDVFSRLLPESLVYLFLSLRQLEKSGFSQKIAPLIPETLLTFESADFALKTLVEDRIRAYRRACNTSY